MSLELASQHGGKDEDEDVAQDDEHLVRVMVRVMVRVRVRVGVMLLSSRAKAMITVPTTAIEASTALLSSCRRSSSGVLVSI